MVRASSTYARLVEVCRRRGCSRDDAEDLIQEAHWRWLAYQRSGAKVRDPAGLLRRIVLNLAINHYHRELSERGARAHASADRLGLLIDLAPGPERTLTAEQELQAAVSLLSAISSARTCQIFLMERAGYSYREIAAAFVIKPRTVEKHVAIGAAEACAIRTQLDGAHAAPLRAEAESARRSDRTAQRPPYAALEGNGQLAAG